MSQEAHEYAREHAIEMRSSFDELATEGRAQFDVIRFSHVLEHMPAPLDQLRRAEPLLRQGGIVWITQPAFPVLRFGEIRGTVQDAAYPSHLHFFSPISLAEMVRRCGFSIVRLFAFQNEQGVARNFRDDLDPDHANRYFNDANVQASWGIGQELAEGRVPSFLGENSLCWATK